MDEQESIAEGLVLSEAIERAGIGREYRALERTLLVDHPVAVEPELERLRSADRTLAARAGLLMEEHERFRQSLDQLAWLRGIIDREDHGGHRQALGQYWRLVLEALRRHLDDEDLFLSINTST